MTGFAGFGVLWRGFLRLEAEDIEKQSQRIRSKFESEIGSTAVKLTDWAAWDDMFDYVLTKSEAFARSNLTAYATLNNLGHDVIIITDKNLRVVNALQNDTGSGAATNLSPAFTNALAGDKNFRTYFLGDNPKVKAGYFDDGQRVWILTAKKITKTDGSGSSPGYLLLCRVVSDALVKKWSEDLHIEFDLEMNRSMTLNVPLKTKISIINNDQISSRTDFSDFAGRRIFSVNGHFKRELMAQGRFTIWLMTAVIAASTALLTLTILWLLQKSILSRLISLSRQLTQISNSNKSGEHVSLAGADEINSVAASINQMIDTIEDRTTQIKDIMRHASFGLFITDTHGKILRGHTRSCGSLLGLGISGLNVSKAFNLNQNQELLFDMIFDQLRDDLIPAEVSLNQLPKRINQNGKVISLHASPIRDTSGAVARVLFSIADISSEADIERENDENKTLVNIFRAKVSFTHLIQHAKSELAEISGSLDEPDQSAARMRLHTLNGNFRTFGLKTLAGTVSQVEDRREIGLADIKRIELATRTWLAKFEHITGVRWNQTTTKTAHELSESELALLERNIADSPFTHPSVKDFVETYGRFARGKRIGDLLSPFASLTLDIAKTLGKKAVFVVQGSDIRVNAEDMRPVIDAIPHLIRNALDHGVETIAERVTAKKQDVATLYLLIEKTEDTGIQITFSDDGRGIDPDAVGAAAARKGLISSSAVDALTPAGKMALVLLPGFTSASEISEISGRGIGLSAVKDLVEEKLRGNFSLESHPGIGTKVCMRVPIAPLELPALGQESLKLKAS